MDVSRGAERLKTKERWVKVEKGENFCQNAPSEVCSDRLMKESTVSPNNGNDPEPFWHIRAAKYDKLYWTKDPGYLSEIIRLGDLAKHHIALDVGTGTGDVAKAVKDHVRHVLTIDTSDSMLEMGDWAGTSVIKWDIGESLFGDSIFHRVFARMVFHHILNNLDRAVLRCYDLLKDGGKIVVAEGVPVVSDPYVVDWYTEMFKLKEERRTFTPELLVHYLSKNGFRNVTVHSHYMENFSIANWVENSGLSEETCKEIMNVHVSAPERIKKLYNMRITDDDCLVRTQNVIVVGDKI